MEDLKICIRGELINLCEATEEFARDSEWYSWLNDQDLTRFFERGEIRNTPDDQVKFFHDAQSSRILFIIAVGERYVGVTSFSEINYEKGEGALSLIVNYKLEPIMVPLISLETAARMTEYAFEQLGWRKIHSGHHVGLKRWAQRKELLGFKTDGIMPDAFHKGDEIADIIVSSIVRSDYFHLKEKRGGQLWDSAKAMLARIRLLPKVSFTDELIDLYSSRRREYYDNISTLP